MSNTKDNRFEIFFGPSTISVPEELPPEWAQNVCEAMARADGHAAKPWHAYLDEVKRVHSAMVAVETPSF